jgi:hypothetical protein
MSPTTREVEAARVERMRREAAARAATPAPAPKSAQARRTARAEEAHRAATARNAWRCRVEECPDVGVWHAPQVDTREAAVAESRRHYLTNHYRASP